jgi:hypothetical protein
MSYSFPLHPRRYDRVGSREKLMTVPLIIMVGSDKGGVGKTTVTRSLIDYLASTGVSGRAFDSENPAGGLARFVPSAKVVDMARVEDQMEMFDVASGVTVIDVRAGMLSKSLATLEQAHLLDDVQTGAVGLVLMHVLGPSVQSLGEVSAAAARIGGGSRHILVKNHISDVTGGYFEWDGADSKFAAVLAQMEPQTVVVPHLAERACETVDKLGVGFTDFCRDAGQSRMLRGYVRTWLTSTWADFDKVGLGGLAKSACAPKEGS